jgi:hypothetical protein
MTLDDALIDADAGLWARFFGTHLPARILNLDFDLPVPYGRAARTDLSVKRVRVRYAASAHDRRARLALVVEHVRTVNRARVAPKQRFALAESATGTPDTDSATVQLESHA